MPSIPQKDVNFFLTISLRFVNDLLKKNKLFEVKQFLQLNKTTFYKNNGSNFFYLNSPFSPRCFVKGQTTYWVTSSPNFFTQFIIFSDAVRFWVRHLRINKKKSFIKLFKKFVRVAVKKPHIYVEISLLIYSLMCWIINL